MLNIEQSLHQCLAAAKEAHEGGYATGMDAVASHIEEALDALEDVLWGDTDPFPEIVLDEEL